MPTTRVRHTVTETDAVAHALDVAARLWPELRNDRAALLRRVIERGAEDVEREADDWLQRRRAAIRETAGILTGVYPPGWREELRNEWPE